MKTIYTGNVRVKGGRDGRVESDDGNLGAALAFPTALGGDGKGTNPEQLFGAGYAACFASTLGAVAKASGAKIESLDVDAEVDMLHDGQSKFDLAVRLLVKASGITQSQLDTFVESAKEACPYSRATRNSIATSIRAEAR